MINGKQDNEYNKIEEENKKCNPFLGNYYWGRLYRMHELVEGATKTNRSKELLKKLYKEIIPTWDEAGELIKPSTNYGKPHMLLNVLYPIAEKNIGNLKDLYLEVAERYKNNGWPSYEAMAFMSHLIRPILEGAQKLGIESFVGADLAGGTKISKDDFSGLVPVGFDRSFLTGHFSYN